MEKASVIGCKARRAALVVTVLISPLYLVLTTSSPTKRLLRL